MLVSPSSLSIEDIVPGETFSSTIESSLGLPSAEDVARREKELAGQVKNVRIEEERRPEESTSTVPLTAGFGMLSGLVSGGMDVLESIGKKTFEAVTVKDDVRLSHFLHEIV